LLQDRSDDEAVKLRRHEHAQPPPMDERQTSHMSLGARETFRGLRRYTFARNDLLFTMSDNTRMQTTRGRDALHARIHFTDEPEVGSKPAFAQASAGNLRHRLACQPKPRSGEGWWSQTESNRRPPACKAGALPTELWPRLFGWLANRSSRIPAQASPIARQRRA
jgi:hypothetical protein